jgi:hypothetical protein
LILFLALYLHSAWFVHPANTVLSIKTKKKFIFLCARKEGDGIPLQAGGSFLGPDGYGHTYAKLYLTLGSGILERSVARQGKSSDIRDW